MAEPSLFPLSAQSSPRHQLPESSAGGQDAAGENDAQDLRRRQSVRFMGPCSTQARNQGFNADRSVEDMMHSPSAHDSGEMSSSAAERGPNAEIPNPPQRAPPPAPLPKIAKSYLHALAAEDEYYTPEDDIASAPSSYRRLHRSRSMFTDSQGTRLRYDNGRQGLADGSLKARAQPVSMSRRLFRSDPNDSKSPNETRTLRAPKSMSFLSSRRSQTRSSTSRREPTSSGLPDLPEDGASATGQSTPRPKYKASTFFGSLNRHSDLRMRKSLRSSSSSTDDLGERCSNAQSQSEEPTTLRLKARKVSRSLKVKLKSIFTGTRSEEERPTIPCQHIESQRTHATRFQTSNTDEEPPVGEDSDPICNPVAKVPTLQSPPPGLAHSSKASVESLSERDRNVSDGSSLTSWAHSGPSTLTSQEQKQWREWEKQRLSVIRENGAHAPSPSLRRRVLGSGVFEPPEDNAKPGPPWPMVNSQRIYSALVKRMQAMDTQEGQGQEEQSEALKAKGLDPADDYAERSSNQTPDTIRRIAPERRYLRASDDMDTPTRSSKRASIRSRDSWNEQSTKHPALSLSSRHGYHSRLSGAFDIERPASVATDVSHHEWRQGQSTMNDDTFTQQSARADWQSRAADSPALHLFRTGSLYRRALRKSMQEEQNAWAQQSADVGQDSDTGTQVRHGNGNGHSGETDSDSAKDLAYSESVYSSDEDTHGPAAAPGGPKRSKTMDTPAMYRPGGCRESSTASSVDWKTWLSANIEKFEPSTSSTKPSGPNTSLPTKPRAFPTGHYPSLRSRGHVREAAQIHDDYDRDYDRNESEDDDDVFHPTPTNTNTNPTPLVHAQHTAALTQVEPNILKPNPCPLRRSLKRITPVLPSSASLHGNVSGIGTDTGTGNGTANTTEKENESPTREPPPAPPIPPKSKLRPEPLRIARPPPPGRFPTSPCVSVLSSPGLTEAVVRQFGGGGGGVMFGHHVSAEYQYRGGDVLGGNGRGVQAPLGIGEVLGLGMDGRDSQGKGQGKGERGGHDESSIAFV